MKQILLQMILSIGNILADCMAVTGQLLIGTSRGCHDNTKGVLLLFNRIDLIL